MHQNDEILALSRNSGDGPRPSHRAGSFVNPNGRTLRDVAVTVTLDIGTVRGGKSKRSR